MSAPRPVPEIWVIKYLMAMVVVFAACIVITMLAALCAEDPATREIAYRMFRDLLAVVASRRRGWLLSRPVNAGPGRPPICPASLILRIDDLRREGLSYAAISDVLNADGISTPGGGPRWHRSYVNRLLHTRHAREVIEQLDRLHQSAATADSG